jgi:alpha-L-rhamnosidase
VSTIDRRTFLATGARVSAAVAVAGALPDRGGPERLAAGLGQESSLPSGTLVPQDLTVNGAVDPVGADPDDLSFAWKLTAPGRTARQTAYRIVVRSGGSGSGTGPARTVWDSGVVTSERQSYVLYRGPILRGDTAYTWTVEVRDGLGGWSRPSRAARFLTALRQADWTAQWLQPSPANVQPDRVTYLRTEVEPPSGRLLRATAYVAAAHTYQLFVNGTLVDRGPSFCFPDEQYFRCVDVTSAVRTGQHNALGVLHHWYGPGKGRPTSFPGLLVQLVLHYQDGRRTVFGTDRSWRQFPGEWLQSPQRNNDGMDFVEWVDGRAHPSGWNAVGYDDAHWGAPGVIGPAGTAPFTRTFVQRTDFDEHVIAPVSVRTLPTGSIVADFGAVYPARLAVRFTQGESGRTIPMHVGFLLDPDGQVSTVHGTQETNLSFTYIMRDGDQTFEALAYLGFRYLQIDNPVGPIGADQIAPIATHTAMPDVPMATFSTGDRMLNSVWKLNARSCLLSCHEQFVDTPTRSKGQFLWDSANESEAIMRCYGDQNLSWQGLRDVARGQARYPLNGACNEVYPNGNGLTTIDTFTERYPEWVWRYYVTTGDLDTAVILYPSTVRVADFVWQARNPVTGLLDGLADVPEGDPTYGYDTNVVADTASNVLGVNAFNRIAQLADLAGDNAGAALQRSRAAQLTASINRLLRLGNGVYIDGLRADGSQSSHPSQESNALALAYGVVPPANVAAVGSFVANLGISVGPNHGLELLRGLAAAGLWDDMVRTLTDVDEPGWAHIVANGGTYTWETWVPSDLIGDSMSHGWGSSALVAMGESLLGLTPLPPTDDGGVRVDIHPPRSGLTRASGSLPTVAGPVSVSWSRSGRRFSLSATIPANAVADVTLPAADRTALRESGGAIGPTSGVISGTYSDGLAVLTLGSGSYRFTSTMA